jgi:hypothetical protein
MAFIFKPLQSWQTKELIRELRETSVQVALLQYDLRMCAYLNHPIEIGTAILLELNDYKAYKLTLKKELEKRV